MIDLNELDAVYKKYDYELKKSSKQMRIYVFKKNMYFGADIIPLEENVNYENEKNEYSKIGYAVIVRNYKSIEDVENTLFDGFFNTEINIERNKKKYGLFVEKQSRLLGPDNLYTYIISPFTSDPPLSASKISDCVNYILNQRGANLIILEAAAGFGKTCTAYELLNEISAQMPSKCTFFAELSRNRENKTFKQVLLTEMDAEFPSMVKSDLVRYHIKTGRIPLIIDGFDELLSKEQWKDKSTNDNFATVETMLTTIGDLLIGEAKVILTSRKTAIFSGEDFKKWLEQYNGQFKVNRFTIEAPRLQDWLDDEKYDLLNGKNIPLKHISNPVLLSYLKNMEINEFKALMKSTESILERYFISLLEREQVRQNLLITPEKQLSIFKKLARLFTEYNITVETKNFVKDLIIDYNPNTLPEIRKNYPQKPTIDELADTLTNHALLDRRDGAGNIGFINDFIFGVLIGQSLCENTFRIKQEDFSQTQLELAVSSFKYQTDQHRRELWEIIRNGSFKTTESFKLYLDITLNNYVSRGFNCQTFEGLIFEDIKFDTNASFIMCIFIDCKFLNCYFDLEIFENTTFLQCTFCDCCVAHLNTDLDFSQAVHTLNCKDYDSGFIEKFDIHSKSEKKVEPIIARVILKKLLKVDERTTKIRLLSLLLREIQDYDNYVILKEIEELRKNNYVEFDGERIIITNEGKSYYNSIN